MDALGFERQFLDHLAPVWHSLPADVRGTFIVETDLADHARSLGIVPSLRGGREVRQLHPQNPVPNATGPTALVASYGDVKIGRRLGYRRFVFLEHGIGQSYGGSRQVTVARHGSYPGGADREDCGLFLVPNDHSADRWRRAYPQARVEVVGSPRLDSLPRRRPGPSPVVAVSFHWDDQMVGSAFGLFRKALPELAQAFTVIGHAHPKADWPQKMEREYQRVGIPFVAAFADVCERADLYVCDNSSTIYEFAATGRPVVLMSRPGWDRVNHGLRFGEARTVGVEVFDPRLLVGAVTEALWDAPARQEARERALRHVYPYRGAEARQRAVDAILTFVGGREAVAA